MAVGRFGHCLEKCLNIFNANTWHCWDSVESQHGLPQESTELDHGRESQRVGRQRTPRFLEVDESVRGKASMVFD